MSVRSTIAEERADAGGLVAANSTPWFFSDEEALAFVEHRSFEPMSMDEALGEAVSGGPTKSGFVVGPEMALRIGAAYACRRVISEDIAKLPIRVVRRERDTKTGRVRTRVQADHPVHWLLNDAPNDWMKPAQFIEYMVGVATFHRGAYSIVQRDAKGRVEELLPMLPGTCEPEIDTFWQMKYRTNGYGEANVFRPEQIFCIAGPMADPWQGHSTINLAKEAIGLAAAMEAAQARFHANDMRPSGILTTESVIKPEQREAIRRAWKSAYGPGGDGGVAVLDSKFEFKTVTAEAAKSEVIENRKFQISDTCRFFRVFPVVIGHNDGSQNFSSVEAMFTAHSQHSLHPWVIRLEQAATLAFLTEEERKQGYAVDVDMDASMRGTPTERYKSYIDATKVFMTPNEVRIREGFDPIDDDPDMDRVQMQRNNTGTTPVMKPTTEFVPKPDPADPAAP